MAGTEDVVIGLEVLELRTFPARIWQRLFAWCDLALP
jgi:hypothetical protein